MKHIGSPLVRQVVLMAELFHLRHHGKPVEVLTLDDKRRLMYLLDELLSAFTLWVVEELVGRAVLIYHTIGKEQHSATNLTSKTHLMGYHKHRHALARQTGHHTKHLVHHRWIERRGGLIKEQYLWLHGQCTGNGYTLFLSTR